ncbi:MAG: zf-TFIIB domain-containing protein [Acidobacteriota bacterium]
MPIDLDDRGRALENEYFRRKEQDLIEKLKGHLAVETAKGTGMQCPRCDGTLGEADYQHIKVDVCDKCHGVWFDAGELAQVIDKDKEGGWFSKLFD